MKRIKRIVELIGYNLWTLIGFEVCFKFFSFVIFTPLFLQLFRLIMRIAGYPYLTLDTIVPFFTNFITIFFVLLLLIFMTFYTMFDIATVLLILDQSKQKKRVRIRDVLPLAFSKCCRLFRIENLPFIFLILFLIPFLNIGVASSFITVKNVPEFILDFLIKNNVFLVLFLILFFFLTSLLLTWIYALPYFVFEDLNFMEAQRKSRNLSRKHHLKDIIRLWNVQLVFFLFYFFFVVFGVAFLLLFEQIFGNILFFKSILTAIVGSFFLFSFFFLSFLGVPISYAVICEMFYTHKQEKRELIQHVLIPMKKETVVYQNKVVRFIVMILLVFFVVGSTYFTYGIYKGYLRFPFMPIKNIAITAHRGASLEFPENTMMAFHAAKDMGADWIELDVQQTKDGKIIVLHDKSLKRTTGIAKTTWNVTYDEIKDLDAGSFKKKKYHQARIPLLEEVLIWAKKNHMKINIELKPTGHEKDFEKSVIDLVKKYDFTEQCVFASQGYSVLETIKGYDSTIKTAYVMSFVYGDITSLTAADIFSIEATSITASLIKQIHSEGKQIYAWTVNAQENIQKMINLEVDNIITDNIMLAKELLSKN